ncbi:holo-ACP synthase [Hazenella coriacea]|uniref:Holo-[acyl-carrier-protein] synthase n=1 Tax=Hazenella coriacea TaxID=1179467 RepID=A0A4R3L2Y8_9BACL|nr:holo-ACP synthase [Hazenella coriacea]TCS93265.1 holo-[acyl-carrier-protein] synthase [Hazenella coriacea]
MIIGVGSDIIELGRIREKGIDRLAKRILTESEMESLPQSEKRRLEYVAGRFAAKEAISKACGTGIGKFLSFQDIDIWVTEKGAPHGKLSEKALERLYHNKVVQIHVSISHSEQVALAMAVIEQIDKFA